MSPLRIIGIALLLSVPIWAEDCTCPPAKLEDLYALSNYVFQGKYVEEQSGKDLPKAYVFVIEDTFKGIPDDTDMILEDAEEGKACALKPELTKSYLVYARWEWGRQYMSKCLGTKSVINAEGDRDVIGPGDRWKAKLYTALRVTCMGKYTTSCCLGSVKSMEEGRFLPEPAEGGCPSGTKPNTLRCKEALSWCEPIK